MGLVDCRLKSTVELHSRRKKKKKASFCDSQKEAEAYNVVTEGVGCK